MNLRLGGSCAASIAEGSVFFFDFPLLLCALVS
eukprot:SAG11_NODE_30674_length_298_cov_1.809045_1_plen_32_part_01